MEVGKQQKLRKNARKAATNLAEKFAALEDTTPAGKLKRRDDHAKHAKRIVQVLNRFVCQRIALAC